jgi:hypothetical protein
MREDRERQALNSKAFELILNMRPSVIPDVSREFIEDNSKSYLLARGLTC